MDSTESPSGNVEELFSLSLLSYGIGRQIQFDEATSHGEEHTLDLPAEAKPLLLDSLAELAMRILDNSQSAPDAEPLEALSLVKGIMASFLNSTADPKERQNADSITLGATYMEAVLAGDVAEVQTLVSGFSTTELIEALLRLNRQLCLLESSATNMTRVQWLGVLLQLGAKASINLLVELPDTQDE